MTYLDDLQKARARWGRAEPGNAAENTLFMDALYHAVTGALRDVAALEAPATPPVAQPPADAGAGDGCECGHRHDAHAGWDDNGCCLDDSCECEDYRRRIAAPQTPTPEPVTSGEPLPCPWCYTRKEPRLLALGSGDFQAECPECECRGPRCGNVSAALRTFRDVAAALQAARDQAAGGAG